MAWAKDGSLFAGETDRGWGSAGDASMGLQRLVWNGRLPFEMRTVKAMPDGFEIEFTKPVSKTSAEDLASYSVQSFIYKYHPVYGSPPVNNKVCTVKGVKLSPDGLKARIIVDGLRENYIHQITLDGVRDEDNSYSLVHPTCYYTLNSIPEGAKLSLTEVSTKNSAKPAKTTAPSKSTTPSKTGTKTIGAKKGTTSVKIPTSAEIKPLLIKNTCAACHNETKRQVGPAFVDVAKRKYSVAQIVKLIYNPQPQNWPDYSTEMPPMPQVPKEEAEKIATWIRSLAK